LRPSSGSTGEEVMSAPRRHYVPICVTTQKLTSSVACAILAAVFSWSSKRRTRTGSTCYLSSSCSRIPALTAKQALQQLRFLRTLPSATEGLYSRHGLSRHQKHIIFNFEADTSYFTDALLLVSFLPVDLSTFPCLLPLFTGKWNWSPSIGLDVS